MQATIRGVLTLADRFQTIWVIHIVSVLVHHANIEPLLSRITCQLFPCNYTYPALSQDYKSPIAQ